MNLAMRCFNCDWGANPPDTNKVIREAYNHLCQCKGPIVVRHFVYPGHKVVTEFFVFHHGTHTSGKDATFKMLEQWQEAAR